MSNSVQHTKTVRMRFWGFATAFAILLSLLSPWFTPGAHADDPYETRYVFQGAPQLLYIPPLYFYSVIATASWTVAVPPEVQNPVIIQANVAVIVQNGANPIAPCNCSVKTSYLQVFDANGNLYTTIGTAPISCGIVNAYDVEYCGQETDSIGIPDPPGSAGPTPPLVMKQLGFITTSTFEGALTYAWGYTWNPPNWSPPSS